MPKSLIRNGGPMLRNSAYMRESIFIAGYRLLRRYAGCLGNRRQADAQLVNVMLERAIDTLPPGAHPVIHTDCGCHYRCPGWIDRMNKAGLVRSMSRKGASRQCGLRGILWKDEKRNVLRALLARCND